MRPAPMCDPQAIQAPLRSKRAAVRRTRSGRNKVGIHLFGSRGALLRSRYLLILRKSVQNPGFSSGTG